MSVKPGLILAGTRKDRMRSVDRGCGGGHLDATPVGTGNIRSEHHGITIHAIDLQGAIDDDFSRSSIRGSAGINFYNRSRPHGQCHPGVDGKCAGDGDAGVGRPVGVGGNGAADICKGRWSDNGNGGIVTEPSDLGAHVHRSHD